MPTTDSTEVKEAVELTLDRLGASVKLILPGNSTVIYAEAAAEEIRRLRKEVEGLKAEKKQLERQLGDVTVPNPIDFHR